MVNDDLVILVVIIAFAATYCILSILPPLFEQKTPISTFYNHPGCNGAILNKSIKSLDLEKNIEGHYEEHGSVSGSFFLGFGSLSGSSSGNGNIKNIMMYYYYSIEPDGSYKLESIPADKTTIYEDAKETPYVEWVGISDTREKDDQVYPTDHELTFEELVNRNKLDKFCDPSPAIYYKIRVENRTLKSGEYYLHIPAGSIKTEYNPNLD